MSHFKTLVIVSLFFGINQLAKSQDFSDYILLHKQTVYFENDQFTLDSVEIKKITAFEKYSDDYKGDYFFKINTHTDQVGSDQYNQELSKKRMVYVQGVLEQEGALSSRIQSQYHGETSPIATQDDDEGKQLNRRGVIELFKKTIPTTISITDDQNNPIPHAKVSWSQRDQEGKTIADEEGNATFKLPYLAKASIQIAAKDHFFVTKDLRPGENLKIPMLKLKEGKVFSVRSMYFRGNSSAMVSTSRPVLEALYETLKINEDLCLEIAGHINYPNSPKLKPETKNFRLSIARSLIIKDSLVAKGISKDRLLSKGYGNWQMVYPKGTDEEKMAKNRRVEFIVKGCSDLKTMKSDTLADRAQFYHDPITKKFSKSSIKYMSLILSKEEQLALFRTLRMHREQGIDSEKYTYMELIKGDIN